MTDPRLTALAQEMRDIYRPGDTAWHQKLIEQVDRWADTLDHLARQPELDNHHNALACPYCNPKGLKFAEASAPRPSGGEQA